MSTQILVDEKGSDEEILSLPEPDYDFLAFSNQSQQENVYNHKSKSLNNSFKSSNKTSEETPLSQYMLGTLIVRVVAARNLKVSTIE